MSLNLKIYLQIIIFSQLSSSNYLQNLILIIVVIIYDHFLIMALNQSMRLIILTQFQNIPYNLLQQTNKLHIIAIMLQQNSKLDNNTISNSSFDGNRQLTQSPLQSNAPNHNQKPSKLLKPKSISNRKHTEDEGFAIEQEEDPQMIIIKKQENSTENTTQSKKFIPYRMKQPKLKLTFIAKQKPSQSLSSTLKKQYHIKSLEMKKSLPSKPINNDPQTLINNCVVKLKRNFVGDNISCQNHSINQNKKIKFQILSKGGKIVYEVIRQSSTYAYMSLLRYKSGIMTSKDDNIASTSLNKCFLGTVNPLKIKQSMTYRYKQAQNPQSVQSSHACQKQNGCFLNNSENQLLKNKLKQSFIYHKKKQIPRKNQDIQFDAQFQSANLELVARISLYAQKERNGQQKNDQNNAAKNRGKTEQKTEVVTEKQSLNNFFQYDLYLRNDTNTHGHQNWFYFKIKNHAKHQKRVKLNVVNLKRNLNLVKDGQKIYLRTIKPEKTQWCGAGQNIEIKQNKDHPVYRGSVRILSFSLILSPQSEYQVSLLPPYTYSQMLQDIQKLKCRQNVRVQTLTYSLIGLAIPIITFTNFNSEQVNKEVILISSRIHPGQTVASFIAKGLIQALSKNQNSQLQEFMNNTIVKIIPMINPDGVVFGNFRTNFLGYDLNRSFHSDDEITNPEVVALKQLGRKLKNIHRQKFTTFIDLHGHSSQKNIFTYGPDFQNGHQKFYKARLLPKLLNSKSPFFKYSSCNFRLEQCKVNTARGFFLSTLNVLSFTIQSSYAIYQKEDGTYKALTPKQWLSFGSSLYESFELMQRLSRTHPIKNRTQLKRAISMTEEESLQLMTNFKKQIKKEETARRVKHISQIDQEDSDGEDQIQDLNSSERQDMQNKLVQNSIRNVILPKVLKPSILYPTVTPKIFSIGQNTCGSYKVLYTRRNRYQSIKMPANAYLHSMQGMESLKPKARNIKLDRKLQFC